MGFAELNKSIAFNQIAIQYFIVSLVPVKIK